MPPSPHRPVDARPRHTSELPETPQRDRSIPARAWIEAPPELDALGGEVGAEARYLRRIHGWLLWRAGPPSRGHARYLAVAADDTGVQHELRLAPDGSAHGTGPSGALHLRFRTWKEDLRDHPRAHPRPADLPRLVAWGLCRGARGLAVQRATGTDFARLPGGSVARGERAAATVVRQMAEEYGLAARAGPLLSVYENLYTSHDGTAGHEVVLVHAMACDLPPGGADHAERPGVRLEWRSPQELAGWATSPPDLAAFARRPPSHLLRRA